MRSDEMTCLIVGVTSERAGHTISIWTDRPGDVVAVVDKLWKARAIKNYSIRVEDAESQCKRVDWEKRQAFASVTASVSPDTTDKNVPASDSEEAESEADDGAE